MVGGCHSALCLSSFVPVQVTFEENRVGEPLVGLECFLWEDVAPTLQAVFSVFDFNFLYQQEGQI